MTSARLMARVLAIGAIGLIAGDGLATDTPDTARAHPAFYATAWPFLLDQWGRGQAFRCAAADCGAQTTLYVRSKVGFCDCFNHVDDDDDIDRLTDFDLVGSDRVVPLAGGQVISVAGEPARTRAFRLDGRDGTRQLAAVVVATDCQALVGMLVSDRDAAPAVAAAALGVLSRSLPPANPVTVAYRPDAAR
jgi:hypothetical protein